MLSPRSEQKREQILKAAGELFIEHGYAVSMSAIAKQADVSKQTVYAHFKTKDELFETCIKGKCAANQIDADLHADPRPIKTALCEFAFRFQSMLLKEGPQKTFKTAVSQLDSHPELAAVYLSAGPKNAVNMLSKYLQLKVDSGELKIDIPLQDAAMQLLLMFHGRAVYWAYLGETTGETEQQRQDYLDNCVDVFLAANKT
ncbi:TetR/AcrR family transcriptional regulator [Psychromonas aquimarina]|uniref:TetR/AcrR family transcriptional regulator n=1 Tax=Psychromonas aquimarina TaxID=444919 RepID=UPI00041AB514|nr:TetR/AcrR family transcriptional regulator [Psychromonas aquimarina]